MSYSSEVLEEIDNYYKLKRQYKISHQNSIAKIMSNENLTIADKRVRVKELMNKCINCKSDGGTIFEETPNYLKAYCGANSKCDLNIEVDKGDQKILLPELLEKLRLSLEDQKTELIKLKIKHAIGSIDDDVALEEFEIKRERLQKITHACSSIEEKLISVTNNIDTQNEINTLKENIYKNIQAFKDILDEYQNTSNESYLGDAIQKYVNDIEPNASKLRETIYIINRIDSNIQDNDSEYKLVQKNYALEELEHDLKPEMQQLIDNYKLSKTKENTSMNSDFMSRSRVNIQRSRDNMSRSRDNISNELKKVIMDRIYFLNYDKKLELFRKYNTEKDVINALSNIAATRGIKSGYVATQRKSLKKLAYLDSLFKKIKQPVNNLLDIGGADGSMGVSIAKMINVDLKDIMLIDVNPQPKEEYKAEGVKYKHGSASQLEVPDDSYDVCILSMVLHHLNTFEKQMKCLEEVYRVLKPGGYLFIREHDVHDNNDKIFKYIHLVYSAVLTNESSVDDAFNEKEYYLKYDEIKNMIKNAGFNVVQPMLKDPNKKNLNEAYGFLVQKPE